MTFLIFVMPACIAKGIALRLAGIQVYDSSILDFCQKDGGQAGMFYTCIYLMQLIDYQRA
jgi:hypothetical protein